MFQIQLKKYREAMGLSQQELADRLGVRQSTVGMWENGTNKPRHSTLIKIADFFNVSVDELTGEAKHSTERDNHLSLDEQMEGIDFALFGEIKELTDEQKQEILDFVRFKKQQNG